VANYTDSTKVLSILGAGVPAGKDLSPWVDSAHVFVARWCPAYDASAQPDGYSAAELEMIERWLAAHLFTVSPDNDATAGNLVRERAGEVEEEYQRRVLGPGLEATEFGRMAMVFDWRGELASLNNKMKTVTQQVPAGKKVLIGGQAIGGGPRLSPEREYRENDARYY
jgi:hypothetical protein